MVILNLYQKVVAMDRIAFDDPEESYKWVDCLTTFYA